MQIGIVCWITGFGRHKSEMIWLGNNRRKTRVIVGWWAKLVNGRIVSDFKEGLENFYSSDAERRPETKGKN